MIWTSKTLNTLTKSVEILPKITSDHNPLLWKARPGKRVRQWRINEDLLSQEENVKWLQKETLCFFTTNMNQETDLQVVWDAYKAVIRGNLITLNNKEKRRRMQQLEQTQKEIGKVETELKKRPGKKTLIRKLKVLQEQLMAELNREMGWNLKKLRQKEFEGGNKPGKYLAWQMKKKRETKVITKLIQEGKETNTHEGIKRLFYKHFAGQFQANKTKVQEKKMEEYLKKINLPMIGEHFREKLNKEITIEEVEDAIRTAKIGKSPGPDGLTAKFYKVLIKDLKAVLQMVMNTILRKGEMPNSWKEAIIALIPKEGQDHTIIKNHRPISLLNNDYKLFARVLAERLKIFLQEYIREEQAGFLPGRQIKDNMRTVLDSIEYYDKHHQKEVCFFFADAEKAFDNLDWSFMFRVLEKMDMGTNFIKAIRAIYSDQTAKIRINTDLTPKLEVSKGTRQGCPLSPLMFILVLEVLFREVQEDIEIKGLRCKGFSYKYRAFADDVMFIIEDPLIGMPKLLQKIKEYGDLAGFHINKNKSKLLCKNVAKKKQEELGKITECEVVNKAKYLGIDITAKNLELYSNNYEKLWKCIDKDMIKWNKLNLSMLGRISAVKMNVLPRLMFLFQNLPIINDVKQFGKWQKKISDFVWAGRKPRIKMKVMTDAKDRGGLQLPNLRLYHEAVCLVWLKEWIVLENRKMLALEGFNNLFGWHAYLEYDKQKADGFFLHHYIRKPLFKVWEKYKKFSGEGRPLWVVPAEVVMPHSEFKGEDWTIYKDLIKFQGKTPQLKGSEELPFEYSWFRYLQIKDVFDKDKANPGFRKEKSELEECMLGDKPKMISKIYKLLLKWETEDETVKVQMVKWAINFNKEIGMDSWEFLWKKSMKISTCTNIKENCYKMMYRWYLTPKKLAVMDNKISDRCWKCKEHLGSFYHMWWTCDKAKQYWTDIHKRMIEILQYSFPKLPELFLVGLHLELINPRDRTLVWYMLAAARILYAQKWKQEEIPSTEDWVSKLVFWSEMDKMTRKLREQDPENFFADWKKLKTYLEKDCNLENKLWSLDFF